MANSIKTNFSAMTALQSLNSTNKALDKTQNRISTGFRVNEAADNAAYWAVSATLRSDNAALSTVSDSLGLGAGLVDVAVTGMTEAKKVLDDMRQKLIGARQSTLNRGLVALDVQSMREALLDIANGASYNGQNWLVASGAASAQIISSYTRNTSGVASIGMIDVFVGSNALFSVTSGTGGILGTIFGNAGTFSSATTDAQLDVFITNATNALELVTRSATQIGSIKAQISSTQDYVKNLRDAIDRGISSLVDADMNEESTRLQALQVQQQLGVQALSIANQSSQSILRLFQ
jgi:flagellin